MTTRISVLSAALIGSLFVFTALGQQPATSSKLVTQKQDSSSSPGARSTKAVSLEQIEQDMTEALTVIENNYIGGKKLDYNEVVKDSIDSMLHTLDPHSNYFDAKEFEQFRTDQSSRYYGIGATIGDLSDDKDNVIATYIKATFEKCRRIRAGLRYGDKIVDINGVNVLGKPFTDVRNLLRGPRGTLARITVEHYGTGQA